MKLPPFRATVSPELKKGYLSSATGFSRPTGLVQGTAIPSSGGARPLLNISQAPPSPAINPTPFLPENTLAEVFDDTAEDNGSAYKAALSSKVAAKQDAVTAGKGCLIWATLPLLAGISPLLKTLAPMLS